MLSNPIILPKENKIIFSISAKSFFGRKKENAIHWKKNKAREEIIDMQNNINNDSYINANPPPFEVELAAQTSCNPLSICVYEKGDPRSITTMFPEESEQYNAVPALTDTQDKVILTTHAQQRLKERCGLQKKSKERIAAKVFEEGLSIEETNGSIRKWMTMVFYNNTNINNIRLYGDKVYLFANQTLITVLFVPKHLRTRVSRLAQNKKLTRKEM